MSIYRHVIFDFDGVICDSAAVAREAFTELRRRFPDLPPAANRKAYGAICSGSLSTCLHRWISPEAAREFWPLHAAAVAARADELRPFPEVVEAIVEFGPGRTSIVSGAHEAVVHSVLRRWPPASELRLFRIVGREQSGRKSEKIRQVTDALGLSLSDVLYVGDLESDALHCREIGVDVALVAYGYQTAEQVAGAGATHVVESVDALRALLRQIVVPTEAKT